MKVVEIITMAVLITAIFITNIVIIALRKRAVWENIHDGDTIICRRPDGVEIEEYVLAFRPDEDRICLHQEGWITKHEFLAGKNEYFLANTD